MLLVPSPDVDDQWLVAVIPVAFFHFLRRRKIRLAVEAMSAAAEDVLRAGGRFTDVRRMANR